MIEGVLFDVDGTLVDHRGAAQAALTRVIEGAPNATRSADQLHVAWWDLERQYMSAYLDGTCSFSEQRRHRLRQFLPLIGERVPLEDAELDGWFSTRYLRFYEDAWKAFPDVADCLDLLTEMSTHPVMGVITNGDRDQQLSKLNRCNLSSAIGEVFTPDVLGAAKPAATCFLAACTRLGLTPERTVYVGDWLQGDARAAENAGLIGVWLDRGVEPDFGGADSESGNEVLGVHRIMSLAELPALVGSGERPE